MNKTYLDQLKNAGTDSKGKSVVYEDNGKRGFGYITSWNARFVFVCFDKTGRGIACPYGNVRMEF